MRQSWIRGKCELGRTWRILFSLYLGSLVVAL